MKKFGLLLVCIFLVVVGSIVGVYYFSQKDDVVEVKEPSKITTYEVTDQRILDILKLFDGPGCDTVIEDYLNDHTVYAKDISAVVASAVPWHRGDLGEQTKISLEEYTKYVQKYFGEDYLLKPKDGDALLCIWSYVESEKAFVKNPEPACGCIFNPSYSRYRIVKAVEKDSILEIDLRVAFYRESGPAFYADYEATRSISGMGIDDNLEFYAAAESFDEASLYRMTFEENAGNYVFVKAERVK